MKLKNSHFGQIKVKVDDKNLPVVSQTMHMGIMRSAHTQESAVQENIKKARWTIYSLMGAGLHVENGLDPDTSIHLLQTYVIPYWVDILKQRASLYSRLELLCVDSYQPGNRHPLFQKVGCVSDVPRVHIKLKLVIGVYILRVNRACFNNNNIDATCQL